MESALFYKTARFLGIPRSRNAFYRKHKFLEGTEHIQSIGHIMEIDHSIQIELTNKAFSCFNCRRSSSNFLRAPSNSSTLRCRTPPPPGITTRCTWREEERERGREGGREGGRGDGGGERTMEEVEREGGEGDR